MKYLVLILTILLSSCITLKQTSINLIKVYNNQVENTGRLSVKKVSVVHLDTDMSEVKSMDEIYDADIILYLNGDLLNMTIIQFGVSTKYDSLKYSNHIILGNTNSFIYKKQDISIEIVNIFNEIKLIQIFNHLNNIKYEYYIR